MKTLYICEGFETRVEIIKGGCRHEDFLRLKEQRDALYLFDFGGFFVAYDDDAKKVVSAFNNTTLDKVKGYHLTTLRSTIAGGIALKVAELQRKGHEVVIVR